MERDDLNLKLYNNLTSYSAIYLILICLIILFLASFHIIKATISIKTNGVIRPINERSELKPSLSGIIDSILIKEGDSVVKGQLLATIKKGNINSRLNQNNFEMTQIVSFIGDLEKLIYTSDYSKVKLFTPLYQLQLNKFLFQVSEHLTAIRKIESELSTCQALLKEKVIAPKEYFDKEIEFERLMALFKAFKNEQKANWQNDLQRYRLELIQLKAQRDEILTDRNKYKLYAPISGILQGVSTRYSGSYISSGDLFCIISPQSSLIGECYVSTRELGLLNINQPVRFQIDAFDYNYFGILTGKIISIDNDFTIVDNKPVFKVRCSFDTTQLHLKNGYKGELKKGLSFQARFIVAERTLWQLLFDKIDDWLNPTAPMPQQLTQRHE